MDEAFVPFEQMIEGLTALRGEILDPITGVRFYIYECAIDSPVELNVFRDQNGTVRVGSVPPLYNVDTTFRPMFHKLSVKAALMQGSDDD